MACNGEMGNEVIAACQLGGLAVPDGIAIIEVDNDELVCGLFDPPLSSIAINFERAGYEAAGVLDRLMRGSRRVPSRIVAARAVWRYAAHRQIFPRCEVADARGLPHGGRQAAD
jgi:LacI family transcriptional regulator